MLQRCPVARGYYHLAWGDREKMTGCQGRHSCAVFQISSLHEESKICKILLLICYLFSKHCEKYAAHKQQLIYRILVVQLVEHRAVMRVVVSWTLAGPTLRVLK